MNPIDFIAALIVLVGLVINIDPLFSIAAIGVGALRGTSLRVMKGLGFKKVEWAVVLCLSYWLASYFWSTGDLGNLVSYDFLRNDGAMLISYSALVFFLGWPLKVRELRVFSIALVTVLGLIAFIGLAQTLHLPYSWVFNPLKIIGEARAEGGGDMFVGWFEAHNTAGGVYAIAAVVALGFLQETGFGWKQRVFRWAVFMSCLGGMLLTYSRGAYFGFVAGAAIVVPFRKMRRKLRTTLLVVVPILLLLVMNSSFVARIDTISDPYYGNNSERIVLWKEALKDFADSPLIGMGYGRYNDVGLQYSGSKGIIWVATRGKIENNNSHAHNSFLHFLAEGGIVGLWVTMFVWWSAWKELSFFQSHFPKSKLYWLEKSAVGAMAVAMVQALTEHMIGRGSVVLLLDALIGLTLAAARMEARTAQAAMHARTPPRQTAKPLGARPRIPVGVR